MNPGSWPNMLLHQQKLTCVHFPAEKFHFSSAGLKYREKGFRVFEKMCKYLPDLGVCDVNYTTSNFKVASSFLTRLLHSSYRLATRSKIGWDTMSHIVVFSPQTGVKPLFQKSDFGWVMSFLWKAWLDSFKIIIRVTYLLQRANKFGCCMVR